MKADARDEFRAQLAELRARYVRRLPESLAQLEQAWLDCAPGPARHLAFQAAQKLAHRLASASATFGLQRLASRARDLETLLQQLVDSESELDGEAWSRVVRQLELVRAEAEQTLGCAAEVPASSMVPSP